MTIAGNPDQVINADNFEDLNNQLDDIKKATCSKILCNYKVFLVNEQLPLVNAFCIREGFFTL